MKNKEFKTYHQLIDILSERGIQIEDGIHENSVIRILEKENYYNIINGYKDLFLIDNCPSEDEKYKQGTSFNEVYALYIFDREIRHIYLKYLLMVENSFKTVLSHEFSRLYGHDNYLTIANFNTT